MHRITFLAAAFASAVTLAAQTINDFFDGTNLQEIRLTMNPADWQTLRDNYLKNTYYKCDFEWRGLSIKGSAVKSRGSGSRNPIKPGLEINFSKYTASQQFLGLNSVILRNFASDPSMLHERLTLQMFARAGLPYERSAHARVYINGTYYGLYQLVEPIDAHFLRARFDEDSGFLYESNSGGTGYQFDYLGDDPALYVPSKFDPKTHAGESDTVLVDMIRTMNQASDTEFAAAIGKYIDLGAFVSHVAMEVFMAESDGFLSESGMTNFYLYRRMSDNRNFPLVWDKEMTFTGPRWPILSDIDRNVLMRRALAVPEYRKRYLDTLHQAAVAAGGGGGWLAQELEREYAQIRTAVEEDPNRVCDVNGSLDRCPLLLFEDEVQYARDFATNRAGFVEDSLRAEGWMLPDMDLNPGSVGNLASGAAVLTPGSLARVRTNLPIGAQPVIGNFPLPTTLGDISLTVGGIPAPLISVSATEIWLQVPWDAPCGPSSVRVQQDAVTNWNSTSSTLSIENRASSPGIFSVNHLSGLAVSAANRAVAGEILVVWASGLGETKTDEPSGTPAPMDRLVNFKATITAKIDDVEAPVVWAGLAPGFAGLQQLILTAPAGVPPGGANIVLLANGEPGAPYAIWIR
jgi:uncharacterized protein (TIGR03437 family)